jgi:hypothetical protein
MSQKISRIIFSGDSFRSATGNPDQIDNVVWLKGKLGELFTDLTGLSSEVRLPLVGNSVSEIFALQDPALVPSLENWARIFWERASEDLVDKIARDCNGALVILFEMPPVMADGLNLAGIPWIDIGISPLRFLPDWAFHIKTSHHFNIKAARDYLLPARETKRYADHVRAWYAPVDIRAPTVVFFAQTLGDRTLIRDGRFVGKEDVLERIVSFARGRPILIKPHPWQPDTDIVEALVELGGDITDSNTYALLACPHVEVMTLSSSVGREARVFGRKVTTLSPSVQDWAYSGSDVLRHALSPRFWGTLLASAGMPVAEAVMARNASWHPDCLRGNILQQGLNAAVWEKYTGLPSPGTGWACTWRSRLRRLVTRRPKP